MSKLRRVDANLDLELLNGVDRGKDDIGIEVRIGIVHAVQRVVVEHDALATCRDRLRGAIATLARTGLARALRERIHVGSQRYQAQVLAAVQRQLGNQLVSDYRSDGGVLGLEQG